MTESELRERYHYNPRNGRIIDRKTRKTQGYVRANGYLYVAGYPAHRLAWFLHTGAWPKGVIDHINHIKRDNRLFNLRDVSVSENSRNQRPRNTPYRELCMDLAWERLVASL